MDIQVSLGLDTLNEGSLQRDFKELLPRVAREISENGGKGSISIVIELAKVPDTTSLISSNYKISHKLPTRKKTGICTMDKNFKLTTDPAPVNLFEGKEEQILRKVSE